jgi:hypothetical protein
MLHHWLIDLVGAEWWGPFGFYRFSCHPWLYQASTLDARRVAPQSLILKATLPALSLNSSAFLT